MLVHAENRSEGLFIYYVIFLGGLGLAKRLLQEVVAMSLRWGDGRPGLVILLSISLLTTFGIIGGQRGVKGGSPLELFMIPLEFHFDPPPRRWFYDPLEIPFPRQIFM